MKNTKSSELLDYLGEIATRSISGIIEWSQLNSSSFHWSQRIDGGEVTVIIKKTPVPNRVLLNSYNADLPKVLQGLEEDIGMPTYLFQVQNKKASSASLSLSSKDRPDLFEALTTIFESAERSMDSRAVDVLKRLLMA